MQALGCLTARHGQCCCHCCCRCCCRAPNACAAPNCCHSRLRNICVHLFSYSRGQSGCWVLHRTHPHLSMLRATECCCCCCCPDGETPADRATLPVRLLAIVQPEAAAGALLAEELLLRWAGTAARRQHAARQRRCQEPSQQYHFADAMPAAPGRSVCCSWTRPKQTPSRGLFCCCCGCDGHRSMYVARASHNWTISQGHWAAPASFGQGSGSRSHF